MAAVIFGILLLLSGLWNLKHLLAELLGGGGMARASGPHLEELVVEENDSDDKIAVIPVEGIIASEAIGAGGYSMVRLIQDQLKVAERDAQVKAVLLKVDSPGGEVLASDDIYHAIAQFQKKSGKPVIAAMGSLAASGGYYVSAPCRWIVANELTITGSIGVIMHGYNYRGLMDKVGLRPQVYKSGKFKDMLSGDRQLDPEKQTALEKEEIEAETRMVQSLIDQTFDKFKSIVAEGRQQANDKNKSNPDEPGVKLSRQWTDYADGRVLSGTEAHRLGFVDELGNWEAAVERANKFAKTKKANLVSYQHPFDLSNLFRLLGKSDAGRVKIDLGLEAPRLKAGQLYFLSPTFIH